MYGTSTKSSLMMVPCGRCGANNFVPATLQKFQTIPCTECRSGVMAPVHMDHFELRSVIGQGGMATVYRATDHVLARQVAVKLMAPALAQDKKEMQNFYREAQHQAGLNHTNIVQIYNYGEFEGRKYLVMEVADQGSLDDRIQKQQVVPELNVLDVGIKISSALELVWKKKLMHLDIKPGNILYNIDGEPKLTDFGIAQHTEDRRDDEAGLLGTPYYIAPERVAEFRQDWRSDLYSLAATLYHALVGRVPFDMPSIEETAYAHVEERLIPPRKIRRDISRDTNRSIEKAMAKDPKRRHSSYGEFIMELEAARSKVAVKTLHR